MSFTRSAAFDRGFSRFQFTHHASPYDAAGHCAALDRLDMLATMFDTAFILPGTNVRFGVESLLRLVPGIGDVIASALSCYLLYEARRLGVPRLLFARMASNVALEALVGAVRLPATPSMCSSAPIAAMSRCCASISRAPAIADTWQAFSGSCSIPALR